MKRLPATTRRGRRVSCGQRLLMFADRTLGAHRCEPDTRLADNSSTDLRFFSMRGAAPRRHAVSATDRVLPRGTKELQMRLITIGLTTILAALALASSTFPALGRAARAVRIGHNRLSRDRK